jgi:hypothetical protein
MEFIIFNSSGYWIAENGLTAEGTKEFLEGWVKERLELNDRNWDVYRGLYRDRLQIPAEVLTTEEEAEFVKNKYGEQPLENKEFVDIMADVNSVYPKVKEDLEELPKWAKKNGIELHVAPIALQYE